jgi:hypothetical protein
MQKGLNAKSAEDMDNPEHTDPLKPENFRFFLCDFLKKKHDNPADIDPPFAQNEMILSGAY